MATERTLYFAAIFTKVILYLCLFVLFLDFYFIKQCQDFIKGETTFSTSFKRKEDAKIPNFLLCPYPAYKKSLLEFNNLSEPYEAIYHSAKYDKHMFEVYKNLTYVPGIDYTLTFTDGNPKELKDGEQSFFGKSYFKVALVPTFKNGMCVLLKTNYHAKKFATMNGRPNTFLINIPNDHKDPPYGFSLYLTDDDSWHEIIYDEWRYTKPSKFHLYTNFEYPNQGKFYIFGLTNTKEVTHMNGVNNRENCIRKLLLDATKDNCSVCNPIIFGFLSGIEMCQNVSDFDCSIDKFGPLDPMNMIHDECLKTASTTEYAADYSTVNLGEGLPSIGFNFRYISQRTEVQEEKLVISSRDFIGSIGGSLGLFLGFSIFHYSSVIIDGLFKRISKALQPFQNNMINISHED